MKNNLTELVFIMDRSGSMAGLESDTIGGFNGMLAKQKKEEGDALVTTVLFDDGFTVLHDRMDIKTVKPITSRDYYVRGCTALLDAVGKTIMMIKQREKATSKEERAGQVLFVITTDGLENASQEFTYEKIKKMIEKQTEKHGWKFLFLGANIDAAAEAAKVGIKARYSAKYCADAEGTQKNFDAVCKVANFVRRNEDISDIWKNEIEDYLQEKEGKKTKR